MEDIKVLKGVFALCAVLFAVMLVLSIYARDGFSSFMWAFLSYACMKVNVAITEKQKEK